MGKMMRVQFCSITPELNQLRDRVHDVCRSFSRSPSKGNLKRLKSLLNQCGDNVHIEAGFYCDYGEQIKFGNNVFINANCTFIDPPKVSEVNITIGDDCLFGPNCQLLAVEHDTDPVQRLQKHNYAKPITIGNNVWLGAGVTVLGGVVIGDNSVVGAGSVVTRSVPENTLYAGNPAVFIRDV